MQALDHLVADVRTAREALGEVRMGYAIGRRTYDDMAAAAKALSAAMYTYSAAKFPGIKPRRIPYQNLLR